MAPRDSQYTKAWNAIGELRQNHLQLPHATLQGYANRLVKSAWFKRRAVKTGETYAVLFTPITTCVRANYCRLGVGHRSPIDLLHQIAHYMLPDNVALHGPEFAKLMLDLVGHVGLDPSKRSPEDRKADREKLKASFQDHGVKFRVYSEGAREQARTRWFARDLQQLRAELREEAP